MNWMKRSPSGNTRRRQFPRWMAPKCSFMKFKVCSIPYIQSFFSLFIKFAKIGLIYNLFFLSIFFFNFKKFLLPYITYKHYVCVTIVFCNVRVIMSKAKIWSSRTWYFLGEASKQIHEYKLKLQKAEQDITNLEGTVSRLKSKKSPWMDNFHVTFILWLNFADQAGKFISWATK